MSEGNKYEYLYHNDAIRIQVSKIKEAVLYGFKNMHFSMEKLEIAHRA